MVTLHLARADTVVRKCQVQGRLEGLTCCADTEHVAIGIFNTLPWESIRKVPYGRLRFGRTFPTEYAPGLLRSV